MQNSDYKQPIEKPPPLYKLVGLWFLSVSSLFTLVGGFDLLGVKGNRNIAVNLAIVGSIVALILLIRWSKNYIDYFRKLEASFYEITNESKSLRKRLDITSQYLDSNYDSSSIILVKNIYRDDTKIVLSLEKSSPKLILGARILLFEKGEGRGVFIIDAERPEEWLASSTIDIDPMWHGYKLNETIITLSPYAIALLGD